MTRLRFLTVMSMIAVVLVGALVADAQEGKKNRGQAIAGKEPPHPPAVGAMAPNFELKNLKGDTVSLKKLTAEHTVVVLVLRGWPGYQCPICTRQVGEFISKKDEFNKSGVELVLIYPGPADLLAEHAKEFQANLVLPANYHYVTDPDYKFTNAWGLRWEAERETAYPSTFIVGKDGKIKFGVTSTTHGDRSSAAKVLEELAHLK
ncbi:MAG: peroxiredoxin family protein [Pirellulaceae bacterium]|nr:peroxiredoxin family protein [Pirellulaceae bacterium]